MERKRRVMIYGLRIGNAGLDWVAHAQTQHTFDRANFSAVVRYLGSMVGRLERRETGHTRISTITRRQRNAMGLHNAARRRSVAAYVRAQYPAKSHASARESPDSNTENL
jgi:hypothetical protein